MAKGNFKVDVSPEMGLYKILQRQSYGIGTALAEFVDNSVQSYNDRYKAIKASEGSEPSLKVRIVISPKDKLIVIEDNAGGINRENFQRAIRMGYGGHAEPDPKSLSVYGIGMKSSAIWFSNKWSIETSALNSREKLTTSFDLDELLKSNRSKIEVKTSLAKEKEHYTKIIITDCLRPLDDPDQQFENMVLPYLQETFFKFKNVFIEIEHDNLHLETDKTYLTEPSPLVYPCVDKDGNKQSDDPITWRRKLDFSHENKKVRGFIMIMNPGSYHGPGIRLLRNRRVIYGTRGGDRQNKPLVILGTSNKYASQRLYGEITLNDFPVNFMKTGFDINMDSLYRAIKSQISASPPDVLEDFVQQATNYRKKKTIEPDPPPKTDEKPKTKGKPTPKSQEKIPFSAELNKALSGLPNSKLYRLYISLCNVSLVKDPVLAYVGAWTLLESLATLIGKDSHTAFNAFYNGKINELYTGSGKKDSQTVIGEIHKKGNMNKHSGTYETMSAIQLVSDFTTIEEFLIHCVNLKTQS